MSAKWRRALAWDDQFFPAWAAPAKWVLRAFSSIWLAVILLSAVCIYGILASIPFGLLVTGLQWTILLAALLVPALIGIVLVRTVTTRAAFAVGVVAAVAAVWWLGVWPRMNPLALEGANWRLFDGVASEFSSVTIRRLPSVEMTELEFYSAWPLQLILGMFVVNMITATIRRIEFNVLNLGVLTVHTGIVTIALGSVYYQNLKKEGDVLLLSSPMPTGQLAPGPAATTFYDNTAITLYARQDGEWEQRHLRGVPRYNDYNLSLFPSMPNGEPGQSAHTLARRPLLVEGTVERDLQLSVPDTTLGYVDDDIRLQVVGYAHYADAQSDWVKTPVPVAGSSIEQINPLRILYLTIGNPGEDEPLPPLGEGARPDVSYIMLPDRPAHRVSDSQMIAVEYTRGMDERRWKALSERIPGRSMHALVVEIPETGERVVLPALVGVTQQVGGYRLAVEELLEEPPFPIITDGFLNATSSVAIVRVEPPEGKGEAFSRYAYHRFPEIDQDILGVASDGRPNRRDADPSILIHYLDADRLQIYFDEDPVTERVRAIIRLPNGLVQTHTDLPPHAVLEDIFAGFEQVPSSGGPRPPVLTLAIAHRWAHTQMFERPVPTPALERDNQFVGTHDKAFLALQVTAPRPPTDPHLGDWSTIVWLPFTRYLGSEAEKIRTVQIPGGRSIQLAFGRRQHLLPNFALRLLEFEMIPYEHAGPPRDFRSVVQILPFTPDMEQWSAEVSLNSPLRAPHKERTEAAAMVDFARRISLGFSPHQLKLSQAGWDATTWRETEAMVRTGQSEVRQPYAMFTILGVGNNPGIYVIALGSILMAVGIPWAFYVKPWLLRRRRDKLAAQAQLQAESKLQAKGTRTTTNPAPIEDPVGAHA